MNKIKMAVFVLAALFCFLFSQTLEMIESENLRATPNGKIIGTLVKGSKVNQELSAGEWVKVSIEGWVYKPSVQSVGNGVNEVKINRINDNKSKPLSITDFKILNIHSKWEGGRFRIIGEIKNIGSHAAGVEVEAIARDASRKIVDSSKFWPNSTNNIYPGRTVGVGHTITQDHRAKTIELKVIDVHVW